MRDTIRRKHYSIRTEDIDCERRAVTVRDTKGDVDRMTMLPESVIRELYDCGHGRDGRRGCG